MSDIQVSPVFAPLAAVSERLHILARQMFPGVRLWLALAFVLAADCIWLQLDPRLSVDPILLAGCGLASFAALTGAGVTAVFGIPRHGFHRRCYQLVMIALFAMAAKPALFILNHTVMSLKLPFADQMLIAADRALGFNWLAYATFIAAHPKLAAVLYQAYEMIHVVVGACVALHIVMRRPERASELAGLLLVTAIGGSLIGIFFPAMAAMAMLGTAELTAQLPPMAGRVFLEPLLAMRSADMLILDRSNLVGITALPSYHATLGMLCVYSCRDSRWLQLPVTAYAFVMLASTPIYGGHYLSDLAAALLFSGFVIWAWRSGLEACFVPRFNSDVAYA